MGRVDEAVRQMHRDDLPRQLVADLLGELERNELVDRVTESVLRTLAFARARRGPLRRRVRGPDAGHDRPDRDRAR
ncbi:MAG: hypothetical protein ACM3ZF_01995 [Mycobacterium leprae]